jgi:hypothetical protein
MKKQPIEVLREGRQGLDPVLTQYGFSFKRGSSGPSSGDESGAYTNGNRKLEIHYRFSLGLVTYRFGETSFDQRSYMRALLGDNGGNRYRGLSDDTTAAFQNLAYDLQNLAGAFLEANLEEFTRLVTAAEELNKIPGFARLP